MIVINCQIAEFTTLLDWMSFRLEADGANAGLRRELCSVPFRSRTHSGASITQYSFVPAAADFIGMRTLKRTRFAIRLKPILFFVVEIEFTDRLGLPAHFALFMGANNWRICCQKFPSFALPPCSRPTIDAVLAIPRCVTWEFFK